LAIKELSNYGVKSLPSFSNTFSGENFTILSNFEYWRLILVAY